MKRKSVLIVDDTQLVLRELRTHCAALGLDVHTSDDAMEAVVALTMSVHPPELIIVDLNLQIDDGMTVCELLCSDRVLAPIPIVVLTNRLDPSTVARCEDLGAHYLLKGPDLWGRLEPIIRELLDLDRKGPDAMPPTHQVIASDAPKVLSIDDDPAIPRALEIKLKPYGIRVLRAYDGVRGYWMALREKPQAIITDFQMQGNGSYLLRSLKSHYLTQSIPVIVLTGRSDLRLKRELLNQGAVEFFRKPLSLESIVHELVKYMPLPYHGANGADERGSPSRATAAPGAARKQPGPAVPEVKHRWGPCPVPGAEPW